MPNDKDNMNLENIENNDNLENTKKIENNEETKNQEGNVAFSDSEEPKEKSKKKLILLIIGLLLVLAIVLGFAFSSHKDSEPAPLTEADYIKHCEAMIIAEVMPNDNKTEKPKEIDWLSYIEVDNDLVKEVTVDHSKVDLTKAGEYEITYHIDVLDSTAQDFDKVVKVKVVTKEDVKKAEEEKKQEEAKQEAEAKEETSKNNATSSSNGSSSGSNTSSNKGTTSNTGSSSNSGSNSSSSSNNKGSSSNSGSSSNNKPTHTHNWQAVTKTIHHDEEGHYENVCVEEAWDEDVYETVAYMVCSECGLKMYNSDEYYNHREETRHGAFVDKYEKVLVDTIHHDAVYKKQWVVDQAAWDETVTTGYKCSCGAIK